VVDRLSAEALAAIGKIAEVYWEDTRGKHGWTDAIVPVPEATIRSIGYVAKDDESGVILVESVDTAEGTTSRWGCSTAIPRSAIRKVKYLRGDDK